MLCCIGWKNQIDLLIEDQNFDEVYEEVSQELEKTQKDSYYNEAARFLYKRYIQKLSKKQ